MNPSLPPSAILQASTSTTSSSPQEPFQLLQLPTHLLCEVLSRCPEARTANALTSTCSELHQLRSNSVAKALSLLRHDFSSTRAAINALKAFKLTTTVRGMDVLMAILPANVETTSLHLLHALDIMFTFSRNMPMLRLSLSLKRPQRDIDALHGGFTVLDYAVQFRRADAVRLLLDHGADPRANGAACLRLAAGSASQSAVLPLLLQGCDFPAEAIDAALSRACAQNNVLACTSLLPLSSRGTEYNIMDAVCAAVDHGSLDALTFLAAYKGDKVGRTSPQHMAFGLCLAARIGHVASAAFLLKEGALVCGPPIPSFVVNWSPRLLDWATPTQRSDMVELLKQYGASLLVEVYDGAELWSFQPL